MLETFVTLSLVGFIVGFIFSVPVAGPISILVTSRALRGERRYATVAAIGAAIVDFLYCFIAVYGIKKLMGTYSSLMPYILLVGAGFVLFLGIKIYRTKVDFMPTDAQHFDADHKNEEENLEKLEHRAERFAHGAFWTGFFINFLNPTLFFGWLTSSFMVISIVASLGFKTGGIETQMDRDFLEKKPADHAVLLAVPANGPRLVMPGADRPATQEQPACRHAEPFRGHDLLLSLCYALFVAIGTIVWFHYFAVFLSRSRHKIRHQAVDRIVKGLALVLCGFGIYLGWQAITML